jgi:transcription termination/antitermination protein NusG
MSESIGNSGPPKPNNGVARWYAIRTRSRHEKTAAQHLVSQGIETFLPLVPQLHRWSDRTKQVEVPLFPGYAFVHFVPLSSERIRVLRSHGVVGFVGPCWDENPIPEKQIQDIRVLLAQNAPFQDHPFLKIGQVVRIRGGSLDGIEGILSANNGNRSLVITVEPIQRSLSIRVEGYQVEVVAERECAQGATKSEKSDEN